MSFSYYNPVQIHFDVDILESLQNLAENELSSKRILLVTSKSFNKHSACGTISAESSKIAQSLTSSKLNRDFFDNHQTSTTILECQDSNTISLIQDARIADSNNTESANQDSNACHTERELVSQILDSNPAESKRANLAQNIAKIFSNIIIYDSVNPNPQLESLQSIKVELKGRYDVVIALGGGSVLDSAKFFALHNEIVANNGSLEIVGEAKAMPLFACPSTAGTGSELTQWATIWDSKANVKYSLSHKCLYPQIAFYDISLLLSLPLSLSIHTTLDSLSHAVESIWNKNANPISTQYAKAAIELILENLPLLYEMLTSLDSKDCTLNTADSRKSTQETTQNLRRNLALACMHAALSFSNTQTALAHAISYPITMRFGVPHGLACSFTLPILLDCISDKNADFILRPYKQRIKNLFKTLHISSNPRDYGLDSTMIEDIFNSLNARAKNGLLDVAKAKKRMLSLL
ncbi:phosphonoacetaldehyde reductase [Helicobacter cinaedi]|uniref:phosphonoacetaldehyde reductase n=1 Tax=Helicobacter cinaedi TaxID=213 RepID=UPI000CF12999|nr:phosphonoacetaldehyde reductase [Helicobacter cinaedi]